MKLLFVLVTLCAFQFTNAQMFWSENFGTGCNQGQLVTAFLSSNGSWTVSNTGTNAGAANVWYVGATENNTGVGNCSDVCGSNATLHLGNIDVSFVTADQGAAYYEGLAGFCGLLPCGATSKRVESPVIDCSQYTDVVLEFSYIEGGNAIDNATVWFYDGTSWTQIADPSKTFSATCSPQGVWTSFSIALPEAANENPNVKIGFQWVNNDDGNATDPSFAVDDIALTGSFVDDVVCLGDFDNNGIINASDLLLFLGGYNCTSDCSPYDLTGDDMVNSADMLYFLSVFGTTCN